MEYLRVFVSTLKSGTLVISDAHFVETSTLTGFVRLARCNFATLVVIVAEKRYVVRSVGSTLRILSKTAPKSRSSSLSASSSTCGDIKR